MLEISFFISKNINIKTFKIKIKTSLYFLPILTMPKTKVLPTGSYITTKAYVKFILHKYIKLPILLINI